MPEVAPSPQGQSKPALWPWWRAGLSGLFLTLIPSWAGRYYFCDKDAWFFFILPYAVALLALAVGVLVASLFLGPRGASLRRILAAMTLLALPSFVAAKPLSRACWEQRVLAPRLKAMDAIAKTGSRDRDEFQVEGYTFKRLFRSASGPVFQLAGGGGPIKPVGILLSGKSDIRSIPVDRYETHSIESSTLPGVYWWCGN